MTDCKNFDHIREILDSNEKGYIDIIWGPDLELEHINIDNKTKEELDTVIRNIRVF